MANKVPLKKNEAILYISIHANASPFNKAPYGFEIWYLPTDYRRDVIDKNATSKEIAHILNIMLEEEFSTESILIAKNISDGLDAQIGKESKRKGMVCRAECKDAERTHRVGFCNQSRRSKTAQYSFLLAKMRARNI